MKTDDEHFKAIEYRCVVGRIERKGITFTLAWKDGFYLIEAAGIVQLSKNKLTQKQAERWASIHLGIAAENYVKNK